MLEIVEYSKNDGYIIVGFRQGNAVVYASVSPKLNELEAKQKAYEQACEALKYEQTLDKPTIDGSEMKLIEVFVPEQSNVKTIKIHGPSSINFVEDVGEQNTTYNVVAYDQYGELVSEQTIKQTFVNIDSVETVSITIDGVTAALNVSVHAYKEPQPNEIDLLRQQIQTQQELIDTLMFEILPSLVEGEI